MAVNQDITHVAATAEMSDFAGRFVDTLTSEQRSKTCFQYMDGERIFWYYPPLNRHGLPLRDMNDNQRDLAFGLLAPCSEFFTLTAAKSSCESPYSAILLLANIPKYAGFDRPINRKRSQSTSLGRSPGTGANIPLAT